MSPIESTDFLLVTFDSNCIVPISFRIPEVNASLTTSTSQVPRVRRDDTSYVERCCGRGGIRKGEGCERSGMSEVERIESVDSVRELFVNSVS